MDVNITKYILSGIYKVQIVVEFDKTDKERAKSFGDPKVDFGGVVVYDKDTGASFTLPVNEKKITHNFKHIEEFDGISLGFETAEKYGKGYEKHMSDLLCQKINEYRSIVDKFSSNKTFTI